MRQAVPHESRVDIGRTEAAWWLMLGLGAPLLPLVAVREFGDSHAGADADDLNRGNNGTHVGGKRRAAHQRWSVQAL